MAFEALSQVPWSSYEHADGPGTDVPQWIEALASSDAKARKRGFEKLSNYVNHQGTAEPVAYEVVPFLVDIAGDKSAKDVDRLLFLLAQFSVGGDHANFLKTGFDPAIAKNWRLRGDITLANLRERVSAGLDAYVARVKDRAAAVRANAALLLAYLPEHSGASVPALEAQLAVEKTDVARASIALALGLLGRSAAKPYEALFGPLPCDAETHPTTDACLDIARLWLEPQAATSQFLAATFAKASALGERIKGLPWSGGYLSDIARRAAIGALTTSGDLKQLGALASAIGVDRIVYPFLEILFPAQKLPPEPLTKAELTAQQIDGLKILLSIAEEHKKTIDSAALSSFGFLSHWELSRITGFSEPGAQDETVDGAPLWLWARRVLSGAVEAERWGQLLDKLGPEKALAVAQDLSPRRYALWLPWPLPYDLEPPYPAAISAFAAVGKLQREALARATSADIAAVVADAECEKAHVGPALLAAYVERTGKVVSPYFDEHLVNCINHNYWDLPNLREVLASLPLARREAILLKADFDEIVTPSTYDPDGPTTRVWRNGWRFVDLCPTETFARKVVAAVNHLFWDNKSPVDARVEQIALDKLASLGSTVVSAIEEARPGAKNLHLKKLLETALERVKAAS